MSVGSIVLIGCGAVSQQFYLPTLRALARAGEIKVAALVDPSEKARGLLSGAFPGAQSVAAISEVSAPEGSLAIVASPPRLHAPQTLEALRRGWHVLSEKPMASTSAECDEMIAAARAAQRILAVGLYKRFFPSSASLKELFTQQNLGPLRSFTVAEGGPFRWPAASPSFFQKSQTPGGVLLDVGVHALDLLIWWLGEPAAYSYFDDSMGGLETNARLELNYANGARGIVQLSRDWATANEYRFVFERGIASWKVNDANGLTLQLGDGSSALRGQLITPITGRLSEAASLPQATNPQSFIRQIRNIFAAIEGREPLLVPGEEGARSLRFIETCYRQRQYLDQPWFTSEERARARQLATA
jgi:predicted dehydrogenase